MSNVGRELAAFYYVGCVFSTTTSLVT